MSRPPGPPPYTAEEIALLTTPEERFVAKAELNSYITGHKLADMRDAGLLGAPYYSVKNTNNGVALGYRRDSSPLLSDTPDANSHEDYDEASPDGNTVGPHRHKERRGFAGYEPYPASHARPNRVDGLTQQRSDQTNKPCPRFTSTGKCARLRCRDVHDVTKLALCKPFLYKNVCTKDTLCSLSHDANPCNTPHCLYFLEERCTNSSCMFAHAHLDRNAPVCQSFGRLGYCDQGEACANLHVYECPDFANNGSCAAGEKCHLRHVHHAARMKAAARNSSPESVVDDDEDLRLVVSSPAETHDQNQAIAQQHDYVAFESQD